MTVSPMAILALLVIVCKRDERPIPKVPAVVDVAPRRRQPPLALARPLQFPLMREKPMNGSAGPIYHSESYEKTRRFTHAADGSFSGSFPMTRGLSLALPPVHPGKDAIRMKLGGRGGVAVGETAILLHPLDI